MCIFKNAKRMASNAGIVASIAAWNAAILYASYKLSEHTCSLKNKK